MPTKRMHGKSVTKTAWKKELAKADWVPYEWDWDAFPETAEGYTEMIAAGEGLSNIQIVKAVNRARKTQASQESKNAQLLAAGHVKPDIKNNEQLRLSKQYELIVANLIGKAKKAGTTLTEDDVRDEARTKASELLDIAWEDEDEDDE
jgi:hypothetical protein